MTTGSQRARARRQMLLACTAAATLVGTAAQAADAEVAEIVVTARLEETLPQDLARFGSDLETVDSETVRTKIYVDLSQALQMEVPGIYIAARNGPFSYVDISLQGSRTGDVLWLIDGVRINNRLYTSTSPADTLPSSMVERIEVLKGGQSLFYGTQAAAGVINVVTRAYTDERFEGSLTLGSDTNSGVHGDVFVRGGGGGHRYVAWFSKDEANGYPAFSRAEPSATLRRRGYDVVSFGGKYGFEFNEDLGLNLYYQHNDAHLDYPSPRLTRLAFNDRDEDIFSASLDWKVSERAAFSIKGYFHDWDSVYSTVNNRVGNISGPPVIVDDLAYWGYEDYGVSALARLNLVGGLELQLGYDFQNYNARDEVLLIAPTTEKVHAFVAQLRTTDAFSETARFAAGFRYNDTGGTDKLVWNVSGRWDVTPQVYLEGMAGTSFILPSAEQLFAFDPCCAVGHPDLKPEESLNANVSVGGQTGRFEWQVTGFARRIDDLILDVYDEPAFPDGIYRNVPGEVNVRGWELQAGAQLTESLTARASYTHTRSRQEGAGRQLDRIPRDQVKASLVYSPPDQPYGASATLLWTGDVLQQVTGFGVVTYGDYAVLDLAAHVYLDGDDRRHRVTARVENAFDEEYATRVNSALIDGSTTQRFLYNFRGVPRTLRVSYAYSF